MQWFKNIADLQYYNPPAGNIPCYCETIMQPNDINLQGYMDYNGNPTYNFTVEMYKPNGVDLLEDVTVAFSFYVAYNPLVNRVYFGMKLNYFTTQMCNNPCFIFKVTITDAAGGTTFDYYTERYCIPSCCLYAYNPTITQDGITIAPTITTDGGAINQSDRGVTPAFTDDCGNNFYRLETYSDCYNKFSGRFYQAGTVLQGSAFAYTNVTYLRGRLIKEADEVRRLYSKNCRLQEMNMQRLFMLEAFIPFPEWKMKELTDGFLDKYIYYNGIRYEANDMTPFERIDFENNCTSLYRLTAQLAECNIRQILGCDETCGENTRGFIVGRMVSPEAAYYSSDKQYLGTTCEDIMNYFMSQQGVLSVEAVDPSDYDCEYECAFLVTAMSLGNIPNSFYYGATIPQNKIYGIPANQLLDLCSIVDSVCQSPEIGGITIEPTVCDTPEIGGITIYAPTSTEVRFDAMNGWVKEPTGNLLTVNTGTAVLDLNIRNVSYPWAGGDDPLPSISEVVALVSYYGRPPIPRIITNADNGSLPTDAAITIFPNGNVLYTGYPTSADGSGSTIELTNITYIL